MNTGEAILLFGVVFSICAAAIGHSISDGLKEIAGALKDKQ